MASTPSSCLFCSSPAPPLLNDEETFEEQEERSKRINNLCSLLQFSCADLNIPDYCSNSMFPLCHAHDEFLEELWEQQQSIDNAKQEIVRKVVEFETYVAHSSFFWKKNEAASSSSSVRGNGEEVEPHTFHKLRDMIIKGYHNKLIAKNQGNLTDPPGLRVVSRNSEIFEGNGGSSDTEIRDKIVDLKSEFTAISENPDLDLQLNARQGELESPVENENGDDHDARSPLLIGDLKGSVMTEVGGNCEVEIEVDAKFSSNIRTIEGEEEVEEEENELETGVDSNSGSDDDSSDAEDNETSYSNETFRISSFHFDNTENLLKETNGMEYLKCSVCNHPFLNPQLTPKGELTTCMKLKLKSHFQTDHKKKPVAAAVPTPNNKRRKSPRSKSDCQLCKRSSDLCLLHKNNKRPKNGSEDEYFVCVCGRPCKSKYHLPRHLFSHKNDEERKAALARKEVGAHSSFLANQLRVQCPVCLGMFSGQGPLTMHMKKHSK